LLDEIEVGTVKGVQPIHIDSFGNRNPSPVESEVLTTSSFDSDNRSDATLKADYAALKKQAHDIGKIKQNVESIIGENGGKAKAKRRNLTV
jgi:hypothetical protein